MGERTRRGRVSSDDCIHTFPGGWQALKLPRSAGEEVPFKTGNGLEIGWGGVSSFSQQRALLL